MLSRRRMETSSSSSSSSALPLSSSLTTTRRRDHRGRHERLPSTEEEGLVQVPVQQLSSLRSTTSTRHMREQEEVEESFEINPIPDETTELNSSHSHDHNHNITLSRATSNTSTNASSHNNAIEADVPISDLEHGNRPVLSSSRPSSSQGLEQQGQQQGQPTQEERGSNQNQQRQAENSNDNDNENDDNDDATQFDTEVQNQLQSLLHQRNTFRHNSYVWTVIIVMLLFRLWVEALISGDMGLFFISLNCTSYFYRWKQWRNVQEQALDDRVENLLRLTVVLDGEENGSGSDNGSASGASAGAHVDGQNDEESGSGQGQGQSQSQRQRQRRLERNRRLRLEFSRQDHVDFEMLSFQAQLALALMESQRIMQNGNYGRDGDDNDDGRLRGVSDDKKKCWESFEYTREDEFYEKIESIQKKNTACGYNSSYSLGKGGAGAIGTCSSDSDEYEAPTCCICLCEYEKGDKLTSLQCGHTYHSDCIESWCSNHVRCPLCNFDLDQNSNGDGSLSNNDGTNHSQRRHHHTDSIV